MKTRQQQIRELLEQDFCSMKLIVLLREDGKSDLRHAVFYASLIVGAFLLPIIKQPSPANRVAGAVALGAFVVLALRGLWYYSYHGYLGLRLCYMLFQQRLLAFQLEREAVAIKRLSLYHLWAKDLQEYEDELRAYVRIYQRNLDRWRREERWSRTNLELTKNLEALLRRFALSPEERGEIFARWEAIQNPARKKRYLSTLESQLGHQAFLSRRALPVATIAETPDIETNSSVDCDVRVAGLENQAARVAREESRRLLAQAQAESSRREKIRLLKQAIRLDMQAQEPVTTSSNKVNTVEAKVAVDIHFISLQDLARERFNLAGVVPSRVDAVMAREIILALLAPGKSGRRFQAAYRAEDTLRVLVRRQYEVHLRKQFNPRVFRDVLSWLVNEEVLFTKPKTDEQVYSLTSKTRGKSDEAQRVIKAFLDFDRSLHIV